MDGCMVNGPMGQALMPGAFRCQARVVPLMDPQQQQGGAVWSSSSSRVGGPGRDLAWLPELEVVVTEHETRYSLQATSLVDWTQVGQADPLTGRQTDRRTAASRRETDGLEAG